MSKADGRYVPKKDIVYWYPMTREMDYFINALMNDLKIRDGYHPPKFQMIDKCIRAMAKERNIDLFVKASETTNPQTEQKFIIGNNHGI